MRANQGEFTVDRIRKLKAERAKLLAEAKDLAAKAGKEDRPLTEDEKTKIADLKAKIGGIDEDVAALESVVELERTAPATTVEVVDKPAPANGKPPVITGGNDLSLEDPYRGFPEGQGGLGVFLHSVIQADLQANDAPIVNGRKETRLLPLKAAVGGDEAHGDSQRYGGFTVPVGFIARLLMLEMEDDPTAGVTTIPMAVPSVEIPARVDKNHSSSVSGGITVGWRPQAVEATASRMDMEQITLKAQSMLGLSYVTEELLKDSAISFAALLEAGFRDAVADAVIEARIRGTGVGEPLGILNSPCLISASSTSQTTSTLKGSNLIDMRSRAWRYSRCVWLANHDCYPQLVECHVSHSNTDTRLFYPGNGTDVPDTILGRPVIFTEYCSSVGTVGDVLLCNWGEYLVGNLQGIELAESMHVRFTSNERAFRVSLRQGGAPWWRSTLTPKESSTTLSPFIGIATRTT
jgi:HK97 family phage major capsid protein